MNKIFKYKITSLPIKFGDYDVLLPKNTIIRHVEVINEELCLWAIINTSIPLEKVTFSLYATGDEVDIYPFKQYITTIVFNENNFVVHVFKNS